MAISFNQDSIWNLRPIGIDSVKKDVESLLVSGEFMEAAFQTVRDQLVFTNKRIISIDIQGITGLRKSFASLPYSRIQYFSIQTPGLGEVFPDTELFIMFSNSFTAKFEFACNTDIAKIGRLISEYVL